MQSKNINSLLIANRGEIACRVIRTAKKMGIKTIAVYSTIDAQSQHVKLADEAYALGGTTPKDSYLRADKIIEIALHSKVDAIHPGYGFLSENSEFAEQCSKNQIIFVGPPVSAIVAMGSKSEAKQIMSEASVPLLPGYHGEDQSPQKLLAEAQRIGFPVLLKAVAGGGGKGMRIVESESNFADALESCQREATSAFGNGDVLLERYLSNPRHVELQIFADQDGNAVHLFERDCSVQRRHQKVIEEAPAPNIPQSVRESMAKVAIDAAQAIGYIGAGTVEFLYDHSDEFYFMEMNTRLQVEHPVTEMITGLDLVEWQLLIASGQPLPLKQNDIVCKGHAFEARIYAEDPNNNFLPGSGSIKFMSTPTISEHVRVDTGIVAGDDISIHYDPMIAKLIVHDSNRLSALARIRGALSDFNIAGITNNISFLHGIASHDAFIKAEFDTGFIEQYGEELIIDNPTVDADIICAATAYFMKRQKANNASSDSPWMLADGWRLNQDNYHRLTLIHQGQKLEVIAHYRENGYLVEHNGNEFFTTATLTDNELLINIDGHQQKILLTETDDQLVLFLGHQNWTIQLVDPAAVNIEQKEESALTAPMPGTVIKVNVSAGDTVEAGDTLVIVEAMKMEHSIKAAKTALIEEVYFNEGELVDEGAELVRFAQQDD